jgi:hypothetical protein
MEAIRTKALFLALGINLSSLAHAGDIPGMQPMLPPHLAPRFNLVFSNDALGRGGEIDDYRTQQLIFSAPINERWSAVLDHSILTLSEPGAEGRLDQVSATLGYRLLELRKDDAISRLTGGFGLRTVGDYGGERMQNGFHRLIDSRLEDLPYSVERGTDAVAWFDAEHFAPFSRRGRWGFAYWLRGRALATSDGQLDSSAAAFAVAMHGSFDVWAGLRQDWRSGYEEPIQRATAVAEEDLSFVLGLRFGGLVLETVQQLDQDGSYGQLRLVSLESAARNGISPPAQVGLEAGFLLPDVHLQLAARFRSTLLTDAGSAWRESVFVSATLGEPQYGNNPLLYRQSVQLGAGLEWEHPLSTTSDWLAAYVSAGAGWRQEKLVGDGALDGLESDSAARVVLLAGAGLRFNTGSLGRHGRYRIQLGLSSWLPAGAESVTIGSSEYTVLQARTALSLGVTFDFH